MNKNRFFFLVFIASFFYITTSLSAQQHISVDLNEPIYEILENAQIKNLCNPLPTIKPYTKQQIIKALNEILKNPKTSKMEREIVQSLLTRYESSKTNKWYMEGRYRYDNSTQTDKVAVVKNKDLQESESLSSGELNNSAATSVGNLQTNAENSTGLNPQFAADSLPDSPQRKSSDETGEVMSVIEVGGNWSSQFDLGTHNGGEDFKLAGVFSTQNWLDLYLRGDISEYFSYNLNFGVGLIDINFNAHKPFSFSQSWDGYLFPFSNPNALGNIEESSAGLRLTPELALSLWNNKIKLNFSRVRRDWGNGDGNLMISKTARPFMAIDGQISPADWVNLSFIVGSLEYFRSDSSKESSKIFQNAYTATQIEFFAKEWAYFGLNSSVIWPKRFELGYGHPGMMALFYQNMIGDYDNMQIGLAARFNVPGYLKMYFSVFADEISPGAGNLFHLDRNMYTWQMGTKFAVPNAPFTTLSLQYTKVEPYMYTHPLTEVPWYSYPVDTSYMNHGESLGYKLFPNSDELKLTLKTTPLWFFSTNFSYSMIRHGITADGSTFEDRLIYNLKELNGAKKGDLYWKDFLKDGVYEWTHCISINGELDLRFVNVPLTVGAGYTFAYKSLRGWNPDTKRYSYLDNVTHGTNNYSKEMQHLFSLYCKIY